MDLDRADLANARISRGTAELPIGIQKILRAHALWVDSFAAEGEQAHLSGADLGNVDLGGSYFSAADLSGCNLAQSGLSDCLFVLAHLKGLTCRAPTCRSPT